MAEPRKDLKSAFHAVLLERREVKTQKPAKLSDIVAQVAAVQVVASRRKKKAASLGLSVNLEAVHRGGRRTALLQYFADSSGCNNLDVPRIRRLLAEGADPNCRDTRGQTVLHEVALNWNPSVATLLVVAGADPNAADCCGRTPLHVAAGADYVAMCRILVRLGASWQHCDENGHSAVFHAAKSDAANALRQLARLGAARIEDRDWRGRTPLYIAAELDRSVAAAELLQMGADAFVTDNTGQVAFVPMVKKMPQLAKEALKQLHTTRRIERRQYFDLFRLDPKELPLEAKTEELEQLINVPYHSVMKAITSTGNYSLVVTPVVSQLIELQWLSFGRRNAIVQLLLQLLTIVLWTAFAVIKEWTSRFRYELPSEIYRIVILAVAAVLTVYSITEEIMEYVGAKRRHQEWQRWRTEKLREDQRHYDKDNEEWQYLEDEIANVAKSPISYFNDFWNYLEWSSNIVLIASLVTHFVDVGYPGGEGNLVCARYHVRLMAANIVMQWMRLLKFVKPFAFLGAFIMMLGMMMSDLLKFILLYLEFFIPFACVFWINFGGTNNLREADIAAAGTLANYNRLNFTRVSVQHFDLVNNFLFSVFRITLVDNYDYDSMEAIDLVTAQILLGLWLAVSAILFLNLLIAQLSETFKAVYDNAKATAVMERAKTMQSFYETMLLRYRVQYHRTLRSDCHPLELPYDDDVTTFDGIEEMQKATLQIRDTLSDMQEKFSRMYGRQLQSMEELDAVSGEREEVEERRVSAMRSRAVAEAADRVQQVEESLCRQLAEFSSMLRDVAIVASRGRSAAAAAAVAVAAADA